MKKRIPVQRMICTNYDYDFDLDDWRDNAANSYSCDPSELTEAEIWNYANEIYNEDFSMELSELENYMDRKGNGILVFGVIQRWYGNSEGVQIFPNFDSAYTFMTKDCDYVKIYDENGHMYLQCSHHDGTNLFEIKILTDKGKTYYKNWYYNRIPGDKRSVWDVREKMEKKYSRLPNYLYENYGSLRVEYQPSEN